MSKKHSDMVQVAAYKIARALSVFDGMDPSVRVQMEHETMARVQRMRVGEPLSIEGDYLIREYVEPPTPPVQENEAGSEVEPPSP